MIGETCDSNKEGGLLLGCMCAVTSVTKGYSSQLHGFPPSFPWLSKDAFNSSVNPTMMSHIGLWTAILKPLEKCLLLSLVVAARCDTIWTSRGDMGTILMEPVETRQWGLVSHIVAYPALSSN